MTAIMYVPVNLSSPSGYGFPSLLLIALFSPHLGGGGIPEPDVVFCGHVTRSPLNAACVPAGMTLSLSGNAETLAVSQTTVVSVNGETFCLSRAPFETHPLADHTPLLAYSLRAVSNSTSNGLATKKRASARNRRISSWSEPICPSCLAWSSTEPNWSRSRPSPPMMARFEIGEVLLTTTIGEIGCEVGCGIVARDIASCEFLTHLEAVELPELRSLGRTRRRAGIERAGEFAGHLARHFLLRDIEYLRRPPSRHFKSDAHQV